MYRETESPSAEILNDSKSNTAICNITGDDLPRAADLRGGTGRVSFFAPITSSEIKLVREEV